MLSKRVGILCSGFLHRRVYFSSLSDDQQHLRNAFSLHTPEDCYRLERSHVQSNPVVKDIVQKYSPSYVCALMKLFPLFDLSPWRFPLPSTIWDDELNHKLFFQWVMIKKQCTSIVDWKAIQQEDIEHFGGKSLLLLYSNSVLKAIYKLYPEYHSSFSSIWTEPSKITQDEICDMVETCRLILDIKTPVDWAKVSLDQLRSLMGSHMSKTLLVHHLKITYPHIEWNELFSLRSKDDSESPLRSQNSINWDHPPSVRNFLTSLVEQYQIKSITDWKKITTQQIIDKGGYEGLKKYSDLFNMIQQHFPELLQTNYNKTTLDLLSDPGIFREVFDETLKSSRTGSELSLQTKLASSFVKKHPMGKYLIAQGGKRLLPIIYPDLKWKNQLKEPDLQRFKELHQPAHSIEPPIETDSLQIWKPWNFSFDPVGCWISEYFQGIRTLWNGEHFLIGNRIIDDIPESFVSLLPKDIAIDGWLLHRDYTPLRILGKEIKWSKMRFLALDIISNEIFESRMYRLKELLPWRDRVCTTAKYTRCSSLVQYIQTFDKVSEKIGRVGLLTVLPQSLYCPKDINSNCFYSRKIHREWGKLDSMYPHGVVVKLDDESLLRVRIGKALKESLLNGKVSRICLGFRGRFQGSGKPHRPFLLYYV